MQPVSAQNEKRPLLDRRGRPLRDLRVSVTDRCNFRCRYCMPRAQVAGTSFLPRSGILDFEAIRRVAGAFVRQGGSKLRLTGGEPLLRRELPKLVGMLSELHVDLALTTNGVLLPRFAKELKQSGLSRVTVSLDALDERVFQKLCDAPGHSARDVLLGIEAAEQAGLGPIKINCVVQKGQNESEVERIARHFEGSAHVVRFIEFMDVGTRNEWTLSDVVTKAEIEEILSRVSRLLPVERSERGEVATRYRYENGRGEVGIIASVSEPFCGDCTRARLSADGKLYSCLFASQGRDVRELLTQDASDEALDQLFCEWWGAREDRYSELRVSGPSPSAGKTALRVLPPERTASGPGRVEMSYIGG